MTYTFLKTQPLPTYMCFLAKIFFLGSSIFGVVFPGSVTASILICQDYFCWLPIPTLIAEGVPSLEGREISLEEDAATECIHGTISRDLWKKKPSIFF